MVGEKGIQVGLTYDTNIFDLNVTLDRVDLAKADPRLACQICAGVSSFNLNRFFGQTPFAFASKVACFWVYTVIIHECMLARVAATFVSSLVPVR